MFNLKQNLYFTGVFALCALAGCSSDNPSSAGSTTIPNATANKIEFTTAATSSIAVDGGELKSFEAENGASVGCSANGITYSSEIQISSNNLVVTHLKLENAGKLCSGIYTRFSASCGSIPDWWEGCDEDGNLELFCGDHRMESLTICTATNPSSCTTKEGDTTVTYSMVTSDFSATATDICSKIFSAESSEMHIKTPSSSSNGDSLKASSSSSASESSSSKKTTPQLIDEYGNPITEIDTAKFTLVNYTAQFTDDPSELSFDSHVLAYNGNSAYSSDLKESAPTIKEITTDKVAEYFPLTAAVAGKKSTRTTASCTSSPLTMEANPQDMC